MEIDHIAIWAKDLEKEKSFYIKYFGCRAGAKYENNVKQFASYFLNFSGGTRIELMHRADISFQNKPDGFGLTHISLNVGTQDKVDQLTKALQLDGFVIESMPRTTGDGYYESVVLDPEGNRIELTTIKDFIISTAALEDLENILYLQKCCYLSEAETINEYNIQPLKQTLNEIRKEFEQQVILKLEYKNKIIGSVRAYEKDTSCYIGKLIVDSEFQNMGLGRKLLLAIEEQFSKVKRYELFTGQKSEKNLYLYNKIGYKAFKSVEFDGHGMVFLEKKNEDV
jgi:lactoylglutathione lyase